MDPMLGLIITVAAAGLSIALALGAVAEAIRGAASAIRVGNEIMETGSTTLRYRIEAVEDAIRDRSK